GLRLAFEQATWGYYFMALAVALVLLEAVSGHLRVTVVAWLILASVVYTVGPTTSSLVFVRVSWGQPVQHAVTPALIALLLILIALTLARRRPRSEVLICSALLIGLVLTSPSAHDPLSHHVPGRYW